MVVMALDKYFRTYEAVTPDFAVNMWLGADYVGQHKYQGRSNEYQVSDVPMSVVPEKGNVTLEKKGQGRLYYRLGLKYAIKDLTPEPLESGFAVVRTYEGADDPNDVQRIDANTWQFKSLAWSYKLFNDNLNSSAAAEDFGSVHFFSFGRRHYESAWSCSAANEGIFIFTAGKNEAESFGFIVAQVLMVERRTPEVRPVIFRFYLFLVFRQVFSHLESAI